jgi:hypothetical protein
VAVRSALPGPAGGRVNELPAGPVSPNRTWKRGNERPVGTRPRSTPMHVGKSASRRGPRKERRRGGHARRVAWPSAGPSSSAPRACITCVRPSVHAGCLAVRALCSHRPYQTHPPAPAPATAHRWGGRSAGTWGGWADPSPHPAVRGFRRCSPRAVGSNRTIRLFRTFDF